MFRQVPIRFMRHDFQFPSRVSRRQPSKLGRRHNSNTPSNFPQKGNETIEASKPRDSKETHTKTLLWYQRLGPISHFIVWFDRTQARRPLITQLCTSLCVYLTGDLLAQNIGDEPYDSKRTLRHLTVGAVASIPGYHWFMYLGSHFNYASRPFSIFVKVVIQQIVFAPIFNTYFFGMQSLLAGASITGALERVQRAVPESVINSIKVWPAVTALNFTLILPQYRFMCAGLVACLWQSYLSWLNQREVHRARLQMTGDRVMQEKA